MGGSGDRYRDYDKWMIISDLHGPYLQKDSFNIVLKIWKQEAFDHMVILGDLGDFQSTSSHKRRIEILNPVKPADVSLSEEVDFIVNDILTPIRKARPKTPIMFIPGNHSRRIIRALRDNPGGLLELVEASARMRKSVWLEDLLHFDELNIQMEYGQDNYGVYYIRHRGIPIALLHGYKTNKTRMSNYLDYFQCHVITGHTHKDDYISRTTRLGKIVGCESMCLRTTRGIEYMDEGHDPGWTNGFVTIWIHKKTGQLWIKQHKIEHGTLEFKGKLYRA